MEGQAGPFGQDLGGEGRIVLHQGHAQAQGGAAVFFGQPGGGGGGPAQGLGGDGGGGSQAHEAELANGGPGPHSGDGTGPIFAGKFNLVDQVLQQPREAIVQLSQGTREGKGVFTEANDEGIASPVQQGGVRSVKFHST